MKYWFFRKSLLLFVLLSCTNLIQAQQPSGVIEVSGRIIDKGLSDMSSNVDMELYIVDYGSVKLTNNGTFAFKAPKGLDIKIEVIPSEFQIMRPLDGLLAGESNSYFIEIFIIHGTQDSLLKNQINSLDEKVRLLEEKDQLSARQISKLDRQILDTVVFFQTIQNSYNSKISNLNARIKKSERQNDVLQDSLITYRNDLNSLKDTVNSLIARLSTALEEKYLRQKAHYDEFTKLLLQYQTGLKDLRDWLPQLENCYKRKEALSQFNQVCVNYGNARNALFDNHENHLTGIKRYWKNENCYIEGDKICQTIFQNIHSDLMIEGVNKEVMPWLKEYATKGTRKVKNVKKAGFEIHEKLAPLIEQIDQDYNNFFDLLSKEL